MKANWTIEKIDAAKAAIKLELDEAGSDPAHRIELALDRIKNLEQDLGGDAQLRCFVYIISALLQHQRRPILSRAQVERLVSTAYAILQVRGIKPGVSRQAFLYGELHQVKSLIYRRDGEHWRSAWEQQLAEHLSTPHRDLGTGYQALSMGTRAMRLGNAASAFAEFTQAQSTLLDEGSRQLVWINAARALRLGGRLAEAVRYSEEGLTALALTQGGKRELLWELQVMAAMESQSLTEMTTNIRKGKSHHQATYIVETFLWASAHKKTAWVERVVKMRTLARNRMVRPKKLGFYFAAAEAIEQCYDTEIPLVLRLKRLGDILSRVHELITIDKELLVQAAAARWLARIHSFALARYVLRQYEVTSLTLSDGANADVLGLTSDLQEASWYAGHKWSAQDGDPPLLSTLSAG